MRIDINITEVQDREGKVIAAHADAYVELSPREGYDMPKVATFEGELNRFLQERVPHLFPEKNHETT